MANVMARTKIMQPPTDPRPPRGRKRVTSYDVAKARGVSQSAVSRCFATHASVAPATRARILKVAKALGYQPNALAQRLISGRTHMVGLLISRLTSLYYPEVLNELRRHLTARNIRTLLFSLNHESDVDGVLEQMWHHSVDGVISAARLSDAQIRFFGDHGVPLVLYNRTSLSILVASVCCDSVTGEQDLVGWLLAAGHRRFAMIAGPKDSYVGEERRVAALARLAREGITDIPMVRGDFGYDSGRAGLHALAVIGPLPDALICVSDLMAAGAIDAARIDRKIAVPDVLSVVCFDRAGPTNWGSYQLTSIRQPVRRMTEAAVSMFERIEDSEILPERRLFLGELIYEKPARLD